MIDKSPIIRTAIFLIAFSAAVFTQTPSPTPGYSDSDAGPVKTPATVSPDTSVTLGDLKARAKRLKIDGEIKTSYDRFRDESHIQTKPRNVVGTAEGVAAIMAGGLYGGPQSGRVIMVGVHCIFKGQNLKGKPDQFALMFQSSNAGYLFLKGTRTLYIVYDGERMEFDALGHDSDIGRGIMGDVNVQESLAYILTRSELQKISNAKKVEFIIGGNEQPRKFGADTLKSWRAILAVTDLDSQ